MTPEYDELRIALVENARHSTPKGDRVAALRHLGSGSSPSDVEAALRAMVTGLNGEDTLALRTLRTDAIRALEDVDVRGAAGLVDAALAIRERRDEAQGAALELRDAEPWPDPVDGAELLNDIAALFRRYLVLSPGAEDVIALWTQHTYAMDAWEHTGYLAIVSPTKQCGKTTVLRLVSSLACRALSADDISGAAMYRTVESWAPTLLADELDRVDKDADIWRLINSGHTRGGMVIRTVGDEHEPRAFSTWSPKVLSYIRGSRCPVPDTVEDRSIVIQMSRRRANETRARLRSRELAQQTEPLRRRLVRWADEHTFELRDAIPEIPEELDDRAADCWEPLLAIADRVGGRWPARARELAVTYSATRGEDERETMSVLLLCDLADLIENRRLIPDGDGLAAVEMCDALRGRRFANVDAGSTDPGVRVRRRDGREELIDATTAFRLVEAGAVELVDASEATLRALVAAGEKLERETARKLHRDGLLVNGADAVGTCRFGRRVD